MNRLLALQRFCLGRLQTASSMQPGGHGPSPTQASHAGEQSRQLSRQSAHNGLNTSERMVAVGSRGCRIGEDSQVAKYTDAEIEQIFVLRDEGYSYRQIATMLDMPRSTVWAVAAGLMRGKVVDHWEKRECRN